MKSNMLAMRLLFTITDVKEAKKIEELLFQAHLPIYYQCRGQGPAKSELLDICGLSGRARLITVTILPQKLVDSIFTSLSQKYHITRKGMGIAGTIPITGIQEIVLKMMDEEMRRKLEENIERNEIEMNKDAMYTMVLTAVKEGYSDHVIDAALKAGAKGGSVIRGRRRGNEAIVQFLGISMQEEQEFVLVIVPKDKKADIMKSVSDSCGLKTPAKGVILSIPIEEIIGLENQ